MNLLYRKFLSKRLLTYSGIYALVLAALLLFLA